jgi:hypothetical protein
MDSLTIQIAFFTSVAFGVVAWSVVAALYVWPRLRGRPREEALQPLLVLHLFRFIGLCFLVPGVVAPDIPMAFVRSAAYGDIITALLALITLATLRSRVGTVFAWVFSLWGTWDLVRAFYLARVSGLVAGQLGAAYFIPTVVVPLLLVTHIMVFRVLLRRSRAAEYDTAPAKRFV